MLSGLVHGLSAVTSPVGLIFLLAGALMGTVLGVIPGLNLVTVLTFVLALINQLSLTDALCLFLGTQAGMYYSASITSILLNTPAHPEAFAVTFDGYAMARNAQPGRALGISAASTCLGAIIGCAALLFAFQGMNGLSSVFHPPEYVALVTLAMVLVGSFGTNSIFKVLVSMGIGLLLASIGPSPINGQERFTFGQVGLTSGVSLVALMLGTIAVPQMVMIFGTASATARQDMTGADLGPVEAVDVPSRLGGQVLTGIQDTFRHWAVLLQGGVTGVVAGIIPGIGGFAANFVSYGTARMVSRKAHEFGTGIPEGIIAPEASSIAKEAGTMLPILGLGIPGNVGGAIFLAALAAKGIKEGYGFMQAYPTIPYEIIWIILLAGVIGTAAGVIAGPQIAKVTRLPGPLMVPFVVALAVVAPFFSDAEFYPVFEVAVLAVVGLVLRRLRYPLASFVLGLVLGPTFETNLYLTRTIYPGFTVFAKRPLADVILALAISVIVAKALQRRGEIRRNQAANGGGDSASAAMPAVAGQSGVIRSVPEEPFPLLSLIATIALLAVGAFAILYGVTNYSFVSYIMPVTAGALVVIPTLFFMLPRDAYRYFRRRTGRSGRDADAVPAGVVRETAAARHATRVLSTDVTTGGEAVQDSFPVGPEAEVRSTSRVGLTQGSESWETAPESAADVGADDGVVDRSWGRNGQYRREVIALGFAVGLVALVWLIGFEWAVGIFMVVYGLTSTRRHFKSFTGQIIYTAVAAAAMVIVIYTLFSFTHLTFTPELNVL